MSAAAKLFLFPRYLVLIVLRMDIGNPLLIKVMKGQRHEIQFAGKAETKASTPRTTRNGTRKLKAEGRAYSVVPTLVSVHLSELTPWGLKAFLFFFFSLFLQQDSNPTPHQRNNPVRPHMALMPYSVST
jgi:hypothetical protein